MTDIYAWILIEDLSDAQNNNFAAFEIKVLRSQNWIGLLTPVYPLPTASHCGAISLAELNSVREDIGANSSHLTEELDRPIECWSVHKEGAISSWVDAEQYQECLRATPLDDFVWAKAKFSSCASLQGSWAYGTLPTIVKTKKWNKTGTNHQLPSAMTRLGFHRPCQRVSKAARALSASEYEQMTKEPRRQRESISFRLERSVMSWRLTSGSHCSSALYHSRHSVDGATVNDAMNTIVDWAIMIIRIRTGQSSS